MFKKINFYLPSLTQCWVIVFIMLVIGGFGIGTLLTVLCNAIGADMANINPLVSYILPIAPALLYIFLAKGNSTVAVPLEKANFGKIGIVAMYPLLAVAIFTLGFVTEPLSSWLPMPDSIKQVFEKILSDSFWAFLTTVIAAPLIEEFILRGVIERGLLKHTAPTNAILWSSFFFAIIHLNPWQAIGAFIAGIFIGWIYWRTHSLAACIFIHAINNGTAYVIQLLNPHMPIGSTYKDLFIGGQENLYYVVFTIFVVLLALIIYIFDRYLPRNNFKETL